MAQNSHLEDVMPASNWLTPKPPSKDTPKKTSPALGSIPSACSSEASIADEISQKRYNYYSAAWEKLLAGGRYSDAITAMQRHLDNMEQRREGFAGTSIYFALLRACGSNAWASHGKPYLDKINLNELSIDDFLDISLINISIMLDWGNVVSTRNNLNSLLPKAKTVGRDHEIYYIIGLTYLYCTSRDYLEASFYQSLLPEGFLLPEKIQTLFKALKFDGAKWDEVRVPTPSRSDGTAQTKPTPSTFPFYRVLPLPKPYAREDLDPNLSVPTPKKVVPAFY
ncbi:hypothetical protein ABW19_dt0210575 [Dactylella cylindrospora]|nr:hypothetical protein ABW19_dt0210575 [Dactylella cylindrospora]